MRNGCHKIDRRLICIIETQLKRLAEIEVCFFEELLSFFWIIRIYLTTLIIGRVARRNTGVDKFGQSRIETLGIAFVSIAYRIAWRTLISEDRFVRHSVRILDIHHKIPIKGDIHWICRKSF